MVAEEGEQPKCLSVNEWINKGWPIHRMRYCSAIKWNEVLIRAIAGYKFGKHFVKRRKPDRKVMYDSIFMSCPE